jgi:nucleobase:cation symporter-1, NCS1 family
MQGESVTGREDPTHLELNTIRPIPLDERHGTARDLFTVWFGVNLTLLAVVTGGLAVTQFGLSFGWASFGLVIGNLVGAVFMALHSAQGPRLGVPQMVQTRGQFGSLGSFLVIGIVIVTYIGFVASNLVIGGETLATIIPGLGEASAIAFVGILSVIGAIFGYDLIHAYTRLISYVAGGVLALAALWIVFVHGLPAHFLNRNSFNMTGLLGTISVAALWQISYAPYVSDYSRYMPYETGARPAFWASYWGCALGSVLPMFLGATIGIALPTVSITDGLASLLYGIAPLVVIVLSVGLSASNAMNMYCGALSTLTIGQTLIPRWSPGARARAIAVLLLFGVALIGALLGRSSFLVNYTNFMLLLLYVLVPWTAINLVDYYLLRHGQYDVASFLRQDGGIYGRVNLVAVACYVIGVIVQLPFVATPMYTGPVAKAIDGADLSWIIGLAVTGPVYYWLAKRYQLNILPRSASAVSSSV